MLTLTLEQVRFCAEECKRQQSGELSVYHMAQAFAYLLSRSQEKDHERNVTPGLLIVLAMTIEPEKNAKGFRLVPVRFKNFSFGIDANLIPQSITSLCDHGQYGLTTDRFYEELMRIHPFIDGNGRVGALVWNYLNRTLDNPTCPPDFFNKGD